MEINEIINIGSSFTVLITVLTALWKLNNYKKEMIVEAVENEQKKTRERDVINQRFDLVEDALTEHIKNYEITNLEFKHRMEINEQRFNDLKNFIEKQFKELWKKLDDNKK